MKRTSKQCENNSNDTAKFDIKKLASIVATILFIIAIGFNAMTNRHQDVVPPVHTENNDIEMQIGNAQGELTVQVDEPQSDVGLQDDTQSVENIETDKSKVEDVQVDEAQETESAQIDDQQEAESVQVAETQSDEVKNDNQDYTYHFKNKNYLDQHYEKHGIDMGFTSAKEYEAAASAVIENPNALHKLEKEDGDDIYYIESTNEFVVLSTRKFIRTYFKPDRGKAYYDKQ